MDSYQATEWEMTENQKTDAERITGLEKGIADLRGFDKKIKWNVIIFGLAMAAWAFFGLKGPIDTANTKIASLDTDQSRLQEVLQQIEKDIDVRRDELSALSDRAREARRVADDAMAKAGTLEIAVGEAKRAARASEDASEDAKKTNEKSLEVIQKVKDVAEGARTASEASSRASQEASAAAQKASESLAEVRRLAEYAKDLTNDIDRTMKGYDRKIAVLSTTFEKIRSMLRTSLPQPAGRAPEPKEPKAPEPAAVTRRINFTISGMGAKVYLNPGPSLLDSYTVSAMNYEGEYLIPDNASVVLTISGMNVMVYADKRLRGRIIEQRTGSGGRIVYR